MHSVTERFQGGAPDRRVRAIKDAADTPSSDSVLYWMIAKRRTRLTLLHDRQAAWARAISRALLVHEASRVSYPYASNQLHRGLNDGMAVDARAFEGSAVGLIPVR